jgi:3-keto-5-aminohexanoate cleavage enzyme
MSRQVGDNILRGDGANPYWQYHLEPPKLAPEPLVVMVTPTGGSITRDQNPNQPYVVEEIAAQVKSAYDMGSQIHHFHVRDEHGRGSDRIEDYVRLHEMVSLECPGMATSLNLSPLGSPTESLEQRFPPDKLALADTVPLLMGSANVGPRVIQNSEAFIREACRYLESRGKKPELAVYNHRMLADVSELVIASGAATPPYLINLCMGIRGAIPATIPNLMGMLELMPDNAVWVLTAAGRNWLPMMAAAVALGGNVRVGMEENVYVYNHSDELIDDCGECVDKIARISGALGRPLASLAETRRILGLAAAKRKGGGG